MACDDGLLGRKSLYKFCFTQQKEKQKKKHDDNFHLMLL